MPLTAETFYKPPIALVDENGAKIKLRLRRMTFEREISHLPKDMREIHELLIKHRGNRNENIYMIVSAWVKLNVYSNPWTSFGYSSEDEYLSAYDLPEGKTLAGWEIMVRLFDKSTFILLGLTVLNFMVELVSSYQEDSDERKRDYQGIFDAYCRENEAFDRDSFYRIARFYVEEKYVKPQAEAEGLEPRHLRRRKEAFQAGKRKQRGTKPVASRQTYGPRIERDFTWKEAKCSSCTSKIAIITGAVAYIKALRTAMKKADLSLPPIPEVLEGLIEE